MIIYTWVGYLHSVDSAFIEQFADSVYYLGFLLTLVALVVSLYFYQSDSLEASLLTANFSLALMTTIFGLAVRIFINNFQLDLNSIERQVMSEVEHAANELVRKAKLISMQLDVSHQETQIAIQQSIEQAAEGMQKMASLMEKNTQASNIALQNNIQTTHQTITNVVDVFAKNIQKIKLPEEIFAEKLSIPLERLLIRLDETQVLLKEVNIGQGKISQSTQSIVSGLSSAVAEVDILAKTISVFNDKLYANTKVNDDFARVVKEIASLSERTIGISANLEQQTEQSALAMQNFTKLVGAVNLLPEHLDIMSSKLKQSSEQVFSAFQAIADNTHAGAKIGSDLQEIAHALTNTRDTVKQISDFGVHVTSTFKRLENFNKLMEQHIQLMADMGGVAQADIDLAVVG
ncbi:MAG: hypothetical protein IBX55_21830 [Methyloprofundus sp.]|nr:hypothetical protein [Methyloprofundus sp.]